MHTYMHICTHVVCVCQPRENGGGKHRRLFGSLPLLSREDPWRLDQESSSREAGDFEGYEDAVWGEGGK